VVTAAKVVVLINLLLVFCSFYYLYLGIRAARVRPADPVPLLLIAIYFAILGHG
jgi:hypothetical protein